VPDAIEYDHAGVSAADLAEEPSGAAARLDRRALCVDAGLTSQSRHADLRRVVVHTGALGRQEFARRSRDGAPRRVIRRRTIAYLSGGLLSTFGFGLVGWGASLMGVRGAVMGGDVSADAQAYFGARPGLAAGRGHDV